jgi:hypothetical protein
METRCSYINNSNEDSLEMLNFVIINKEKNLVSYSCTIMTFAISLS